MTAVFRNTSQEGEQQLERPFRPLFTIRRSGRVEVTVYGIVSVVTGAERRPLIASGDTTFELWSRSLLKPWQLLTIYSTLKSNYPALKDEHLALCMASHSAEDCHMKALDEIMAITGVGENNLKCPEAVPLDIQLRDASGVHTRVPERRRRYHNCSGKHSAFLAAVKATQGEAKMADYLNEAEPHHQRLRSILSKLARRPEESFSTTTDGCQLVNFALSTSEMAFLYMSLLNPSVLPEELKSDPLFEQYADLGRLMRTSPRMVSGSGRLDYKIMTGEAFEGAPAMVAKEGADGLLGIGVAPCEKYPSGLGVTIKLSSGFDNHHMERISRHLFVALGLIEARPPVVVEGVRTDHTNSEYHFLAGLK